MRVMLAVCRNSGTRGREASEKKEDKGSESLRDSVTTDGLLDNKNELLWDVCVCVGDHSSGQKYLVLYMLHAIHIPWPVFITTDP